MIKNKTNIEVYNIKKKYKFIKDCSISKNFKFVKPVNLYECEIGENVFVGPFVEIGKNVKINDNTRISSHSFICELVTIGKNCFIGHGVMFTNDLLPRATNLDGSAQNENDWTLVETFVKKGASIGSNATILCGITIGENSLIGAGSVVVNDVPKNSIVVGNPARVIKKI
jgi:acetyltransferase-like isoleucine patch superfamily enzyme